MVQLVLPNEILNDTPADATPVDQNYKYIQSHINQQMINRDGSVAMTGQLHLVGDPVNDVDAASKAYVDAVLPIGIMLPFGGVTAPSGGHWAICNGASLAIATYHKLYEALGTRFNVGTVPAGRFLIPNTAGRFLIGVDATQTTFDLVGETGGTWTVPVAPHAHPMPHTHEHNHTHTIDHNHPSATTGAGGAHNHDLSYFTDMTTGGASTRVVGYVSSGLHTTTETAPTHTHTIDLPVTTGLKSGVPNEATTSAVSTANTSNNTKALTTTADIGTTHKPPYLTVTYIIRID